MILETFSIKKKILVRKNNIEKPEEKDDTKELEEKVLKKGMNNVRKKRNKDKQKKHQREQINIRRVIEHEKRKHEETKKGQKTRRKKREIKRREREQLRKSKNKDWVNTKIKRINLFFEVFFLTETKRLRQKETRYLHEKDKKRKNWRSCMKKTKQIKSKKLSKSRKQRFFFQE